MKVAVTSSAFERVLRRGELTHLEWLEGVASRLDADGAAFALADFPRDDPEYAAQVRKVAVDMGIVPLALDAPGLLDPERSDGERAAAMALAAAVGVLFVRTSAGAPGALPPQTFVRTVAAAKALAKAGKAANVTVAVAPEIGSLVATLADVKHLAKDVDSAWLRYELACDDPARDALTARERVLVERYALGTVPPVDIARRRGWFVIEGDGGDDPFATVAASIAALRAAEARARLAPI